MFVDCCVLVFLCVRFCFFQTEHPKSRYFERKSDLLLQIKTSKIFCNNASNTETFHVTSYVKGFAVTMVSRIETLKSHLTPSTDF